MKEKILLRIRELINFYRGADNIDMRICAFIAKQTNDDSMSYSALLCKLNHVEVLKALARMGVVFESLAVKKDFERYVVGNTLDNIQIFPISYSSNMPSLLQAIDQSDYPEHNAQIKKCKYVSIGCCSDSSKLIFICNGRSYVPKDKHFSFKVLSDSQQEESFSSVETDLFKIPLSICAVFLDNQCLILNQAGENLFNIPKFKEIYAMQKIALISKNIASDETESATFLAKVVLKNKKNIELMQNFNNERFEKIKNGDAQFLRLLTEDEISIDPSNKIIINSESSANKVFSFLCNALAFDKYDALVKKVPFAEPIEEAT